MKKQQYNNHVKYYPPHHFVFLPVVGFSVAVGTIKAFTDTEHCLLWALFAILSFFILYLAIMLRQHYALGNQDRIVRLEFRLRYFQVFGESSSQVEEELSFAQIAALRFAGDDEFKTLLRRATIENLDADIIKRSIQNWKADNMRV